MKLLLSESQLEMLIGHIEKTEGKKHKEVLGEGWKEVVLGAAMLMGIGLSGANAQTAKNALENETTLKKIENTLEGPQIEKLASTLEKAGLEGAMDKIQANAEQIKQNFDAAASKKKLDIRISQIYKTRNLRQVKSKVKQGYAISAIEITKDTVWSQNDKIEISNVIELNFDSNIFKTASFDLNDAVSNELKETIEGILMMGGTVTSVEIVSSTDTEPIKMGNEKLSQLRANSIKKVIDGMGVNTKFNIKTLADQGPDVYSRTMSPQERKETRKATAEHRYVTVKINSVVQPQPTEETKAFEVIEKVKYQLVKSVVTGHKTTTVGGKSHFKKGTTPKKFKCLKLKVNKDLLSCPSNL